MEDQAASLIKNTIKTFCEYWFLLRLTTNANRHYHYKFFKHKKNYRLTIRNNRISLFKAERLSQSTNYIEQKIDNQFPELRGLK